MILFCLKNFKSAWFKFVIYCGNFINLIFTEITYSILQICNTTRGRHLTLPDKVLMGGRKDTGPP